MLDDNELKSLLFVDIETVAKYQNLKDIPDAEMQNLWVQQAKQSYSYQIKDGLTEAELWSSKAALHPEFAKIVVISMGYLVLENETTILKVKPLYGDNEVELLNSLSFVLSRPTPKIDHLVAHNGKKFDFPFLFKRYLINGLAVPELLKTIGKKPWELPNIDTMELWNCGFNGYYSSLDLLCKLFNSPVKRVLDSSKIHDTYYVENDLEKIAKHCVADVVAVAKVLLKIYGINRTINDLIVV